MRVKGNVLPNVLNIEPYAPKAGHVEVRLRDSINPIVEKDWMTGQEIPMFEYDEYIFILPDREGLRDDIEESIAEWLATGRTMEVHENASIVADQRQRVSELEAENETMLADIAQLVEEVYQSDMEMMGI